MVIPNSDTVHHNELAPVSSSQTSSIYRQAYITESNVQLTPSAIKELERVSSARCGRLGIKNLIVVMDGRVIQIMEGPEQRVKKLMGMIMRDKVQQQLVKLFSSHRIERYTLKESNLIIRNSSHVPDDVLTKLRDLAMTFQWAQEKIVISSCDMGFLKSLAIFTFQREHHDLSGRCFTIAS